MINKEIIMSESEKFTNTTAFRVASIAVLSAIVAIFTIAVRIPVAPTRGYINLGDVAIFFAAFIFGPVTAFIAGGLGTAIADILGGFGQWAPISFVVHGLQGFVIGLVYNMLLKKEADSGKGNLLLQGVLTFAAGAAVMVAGYYVASVFMVGPGAAAVEIPGNIFQNIAGVIGGLALTAAVRKAYPPVIKFRW